MTPTGLLTLYRSLTRHKLYAALSIGGLALGIAVFLVLFLYVQFERSYNRVLPAADKLWEVSDAWHIPGLPTTPYLSNIGSLLDQIHGDYPDVVGTRYWDRQGAVMRGATSTSEQVALVDPTFFDLFPFPVVAGDAKAALRDPDAVVITQNIASKYFGSQSPVGEPMTLVIKGIPRAYHVGAVLKDMPKNMTIKDELIVPLVVSRIIADKEPYFFHWGSEQLETILRFPDAAAAKAFEAKLPGFIDRHAATDMGPNAHEQLSEALMPLSEVHLRDAGDRAVINTLGIVGILTLFIAIVNYVNLATARAGLRAREVAVRKVLGGTQRSLIRQFLGEAVATVAVAALIGLALAELALPFVNSLGGTSLAIHYLGAQSILLPLIVLVVIVGVLAGIYPAFVLSNFRPAAVLASARAPGGGRAGARLRQALVVFQFAIAIAFTIGTGVLVAQTRHLQSADLGFKRDGVANVDSFVNESLDEATRASLLNAFRGIPGVTGVTSANDAPGVEYITNASNMHRPGSTGPSPSITWVKTGPDFFDVFEAHLIAGRLFDASHALDDLADVADEDRSKDTRNIVLNRSGAQKLGFANPKAAIGQIVIEGDGRTIQIPDRVIGVVEDMRFRSPHEPVRPTVYYHYSRDMSDPIAVVRYGDANPRLVLNRIEDAWKRIAPAVPFKGETVDQSLYDNYYKQDAQRSRLFTIGAVLAVLIGCIGLYGLASFDTARRVKEIGIRKTLGASTRDILKLLIGQFMRPVVLANIIAWPLAFVVMRKWLAGFDDRVALSPLFFLGASLIAVLIATATIFGQAWRVARAEPARALRYE